MNLPVPIPGLVIRYSYLRHSEHLQGREEGVKDRPCAVVLVTETDAGGELVTVLPVMHTPPANANLALEIPSTVKQRLNLDGERSWIVFAEMNRFVWPGPDLHPLPGRDISTIAYGVLPPKFFEHLKARLLQTARARRTRTVPRTD
ncbi:MAG: hypothetical protein WCA78_01015 [Rhizomicrobium sp.]